MNIKCPNCGGTMFFDPESGQMKCTQCQGRLNDIHEKARKAEQKDSGDMDFTGLWYGLKKGQCWGNMGLEHGEEYDEEWEISDIAAFTDDSGIDGVYRADSLKRMEVKIYTCTACGANLMINGNETSTFCSFCGQPTIVFDRVSNERRPDYIIPFRITAEQAEKNIRKRFRKGDFVPKDIKNFTVEDLRGIYIPYWLYTSYIRKKANINQTIKKRNSTEVKPSYRDAQCVYSRMAMDASRKMNNELGQRLLPYEMEDLVEFTPEVLSGFYADRYDVASREVAPAVYNICDYYITEDIMDTVEGYGVNDKKIVKSMNLYYVQNIEYALLPVWFLTFRYKKKVYTVLVNGQTGKVVGNVPFNKGKAVFQCVVLSCLFSLLASAIVIELGNPLWDESFFMTVFTTIIAGAVAVLADGIMRLIRYKNDGRRFESLNIRSFVKERQDKTWIR